MTKREKELQLLRNRITRMEASREAAIRMLVRATLELPKLRKQEARLETAIGKRQARPVAPPEPEPIPDGVAIMKDGKPEVIVKDEDLLEIPGYLRRDVYEAAHAVANNHNKLATPEQKKLVAQEKRKVKEEHKHADLTGQKRKWPATGRAAANLLK